VLIDVVRYSLQNLKRLSALEAQDRPLEAGSGEHLQRRWLRRYSPASDPTLLGIRSVLTMVMELALYVCMAHINVFVARHVAMHFPAGYEVSPMPEVAVAGSATIVPDVMAAHTFLQGYKDKLDRLLVELQDYVQHTPQSPLSLAEDYVKHSLPQLLRILEEHVPPSRPDAETPGQLLLDVEGELSTPSRTFTRWSSGAVTPRSAAPLTPRFGIY
jgi:hypothetical protein